MLYQPTRSAGTDILARSVAIIVLLLSAPPCHAFSATSPRQGTFKRVESHIFSSSARRGCGTALQAKRTTTASPKYVRWHKTSDGTWAMQTAVTTFQLSRPSTSLSPNKESRVELHSQLHFGTHGYFDYYNTEKFNQDRLVLYELLLDEALLQQDERTGRRTVQTALSASPADQQTAQQYQWSCQVDVIQYNKIDNWIHADLTRQEFLNRAEATSSQKNEPLWKVAGNKNLAGEAATAFRLGPPILDTASNPDGSSMTADSFGATIQRRLFSSNFFLSGSSVAQTLRALLWFAVPSPELFILLLDWATLTVSATGPSLSQITVPLIQSLSKGDLNAIRKLAFGQIVIAGNQISSSSGGRDNYDLLIKQRNQKALNVLQQTQQAMVLEEAKTKYSGSNPAMMADKPKTLALLYGCSHCLDLHQRLVSQGYRATKTEWRTAWSVSPGVGATQDPESITAAGLLIMLPLYFAVGGLDWIGTLGQILGTINNGSGAWAEQFGDAALYLGRHVLLYVGLSRILLDWEEAPRND